MRNRSRNKRKQRQYGGRCWAQSSFFLCVRLPLSEPFETDFVRSCVSVLPCCTIAFSSVRHTMQIQNSSRGLVQQAVNAEKPTPYGNPRFGSRWNPSRWTRGTLIGITIATLIILAAVIVGATLGAEANADPDYSPLIYNPMDTYSGRDFLTASTTSRATILLLASSTTFPERRLHPSSRPRHLRQLNDSSHHQGLQDDCQAQTGRPSPHQGAGTRQTTMRIVVSQAQKSATAKPSTRTTAASTRWNGETLGSESGSFCDWMYPLIFRVTPPILPRQIHRRGVPH